MDRGCKLGGAITAFTILFSSCAKYTTYSTNNEGYPLVNEKIDQVTLTPVNAYSASGVVFLNEAPKLPFTLTFRFNIFDDDGSAYNIWNSADGIALMIGKDESSYKKGNPPIGGTMGHIDDGTGVTLFFKT